MTKDNAHPSTMAVDLKVSRIQAPSSGQSIIWKAGTGRPGGTAARRAPAFQTMDWPLDGTFSADS